MLIKHLNDVETEAWERLQQGPIELESLVDSNRPMMRAIARMERMGLVYTAGSRHRMQPMCWE